MRISNTMLTLQPVSQRPITTTIVGLVMIYNINCLKFVLTILTGCSMKNDHPGRPFPWVVE